MGIAVLYILIGLLLIPISIAAIVGSAIGGKPVPEMVAVGLVICGPVAILAGLVQLRPLRAIEKAHSEGKGLYSKETESFWNRVYLLRVIPLVLTGLVLLLVLIAT
jgi:hypothetical protein